MNTLQNPADVSIGNYSQGKRNIVKSSSLSWQLVRLQNASSLGRHSSHAPDIKKLSLESRKHGPLVSPVNSYGRWILSAVGSQSYSNFDTDPYKVEGKLYSNIEEKATKNNGFLDNVKEILFRRDQLHPSDFRAELLFLALPAIVGQAIDPLAQLAETAFIGRLGAIELASAGISVTIFNIISKLFNVPLLSITTSFVAEDISKNVNTAISDNGSPSRKSEDKPIAEKTTIKQQLPSVSTALLLALVIGAFEALALFWGSGKFLNMMGVAQASSMHNPARQFLSLRALGAPAVVLSLAIQGIFRGFKDTQTPVACIGLGNAAAVMLLPILVFTLRLGLFGAAIATVASQYITTALLISSLSKQAVLLPPRVKDLQFDGYIKSGGLLLGRTLSVLITMTLGTSMAARQGPVAMAAHQICLQVWLAVSLLSDALALSAQAMVASSFAKFDYKRVKDITEFVLKIGLLTGITLAVILGSSFGSLAKLFTKDAEVLQIVKTGVLFVSASQPINALAFIFDGLHYGVSDFSYAACSMMAVGLLSSAVLLYAPSLFGLPGVWLGLTLFMALRMTAGFVRLQWNTGPWWFLKKEYRIPEVGEYN